MRTATRRARWCLLFLPLTVVILSGWYSVDEQTHASQVRGFAHDWSSETFEAAKGWWGPAFYPHLDWTDDGCSGGWARQVNEWRYWPSVPIGSFHDQCERHDFGYRNYKALERIHGSNWWNDYSRSVVDSRFLGDMRQECASLYPHWTQGVRLLACHTKANDFYVAVRWFGG